VQHAGHTGLHALDVNVQLILSAHDGRVHRQAHGLAVQRMADHGIQTVPGRPGSGKIIRRCIAQHGRVFDAGGAACGDQQVMRAALAIGQHREIRRHDARTGCRVMQLLPVRQALVLHDVFERIAVGCVNRRCAQGADYEND
jgi:hypothetical protein